MATAKKPATPKATEVPKVVSVHIPRAEKGEENYITASLNGKVWKLQKGTTVTIPVELAEILNTAEENAIKADDYTEAKSNEQ